MIVIPCRVDWIPDLISYIGLRFYIVMSQPFVHLHVHTRYSLLDGACQIDPLMEAVQKKGMTSIAITDHGVMYGIVDFYKAARARGIKPILGCEVYEAPGSRFEHKSEGIKAAANHLVLLAVDEAGYANLMRLVTLAHLEGFYYKPRIDREILSQYHTGLIGLSACLTGRIARDVLSGDSAAPLKTAGEYADIFGKDNFFLELQDHRIPEQEKVNAGLVELARRTGLPLIASNDVHYLEKNHAAAHEVLLCIQTGTVMSNPKRMRYSTQEFYLKSGDEMHALFSEFPQALANTVEIAHRCNVELSFSEHHFPEFKVPQGYQDKSYLISLCLQGVRKRYGVQDPQHPLNEQERAVMKRLHYEINVIEKARFIGYFLVVWDLVRFAREQRIPIGPGRGSGAGSLVSYVLGITGIDPLRYGLIFERFLNPERVSPPDFDIDFCQLRRGEVIEYIKQKYGRGNVAQIITFGKLGAKIVIRDVGRVLEVPLVECDRLAKMVPDGPNVTLKDALAQTEFQKLLQKDANAGRIMKYALVIEGLLRNASVHAAGVVIGDRPLIDLLPLTRDKFGEVLTQYTMKHVEMIGLLKADILGLRTLSVIEETLALINKIKGVALDIDTIPPDDRLTYQLLQRGDAIGVFQLESKGMRDLSRRIGLDRIEDLIALVALFRPGPMHLLEDYVKRKTGMVKIVYDHPLLEPVLKETYGIMLYQEQVQQVANVLAGYSLGQGDILRRAMGKKDPATMEKQRKPFIEGCKKHAGISPAKAEKIFDSVSKFAGYGFNKSHATGYATVAYQTAYLKTHYPEEFMAALLSSEIGNFDKLPVFMAEVQAMDLEILPPDVNLSVERFAPQKGGIRFGLAGIKNVGAGAAEAIVKERESGGAYQGLIDFCGRLDSKAANRKVLETLVRCGAFDSLGLHRAQLFNNINMALARSEAAKRDRQVGQRGLFDALDKAKDESRQTENLPDHPRWHESELLSAEKELLGIYLSGHPLTQYEHLLQRYCLSTVQNLMNLEENAVTRIGGIISRLEKKTTREKKEMMAIVQIEDLDGTLEAVFFPDAYREHENVLKENAAIIVCGEIRKNEESARMIVFEAYPLDQAPRLFTEHLSLHLATAKVTDELLEQINNVLKKYPGPTPVTICLIFPTGEEVFLSTSSSFRVTASEALLHDLQHLVGEDSVYVAVINRPCLRSSDPRKKRNSFRRQF